MQDRPDRLALSTVVANRSIAEERAVGARQPVIVNGGHNRNPRIAASIEHSRAEQGKRIVDMDNLGVVLAQYCFQITGGFAAPDGPGRQ
jgi:hypothetical protein